MLPIQLDEGIILEITVAYLCTYGKVMKVRCIWYDARMPGRWFNVHDDRRDAQFRTSVTCTTLTNVNAKAPNVQRWHN